MKTIEELTDSTTSTTGFSNIEPKVWLKEINDAAQKKFFFRQICSEYNLPEGTKDLVVPYRNLYLSSMTDTTSEGGAVGFTELTNLSGITFTPTMHSHGVAISNYAIQTNALNLIQAAKDDLTNYFADTVDQAIVTALAAAGAATSSARGMQQIFGGDAVSTATLAAGDVLTTDLVADAKRRLMSTKVRYWDTTEKVSSATKPPWYPEPDSPFVLLISAEQEAALMKDSQFINAAEYGTNEVVMNGEIGKYLGIKVLVSPNVTSATNWGGASLAGHTCYMVKSKYCAGLAFGSGTNPDLSVFPYPRELEQDLILYTTYHADTIHDDAVVLLSVADD